VFSNWSAIIILATDVHGKTRIKKEELGNLSENEKENILLWKSVLICVNPWQKKSKWEFLELVTRESSKYLNQKFETNSH